MIFSKKWRYLLVIVVSLLVLYKPVEQIITEKIYEHKMHLIDDLSYYKMKDYDTLYQIKTSDPTDGRSNWDSCYYGWITKRNNNGVLFLNTNGTEIELTKKQIISVNPLPINDATIAIFARRLKNDDAFDVENFGKFYLLNLWLYQKEKFNYSKQLKSPNFFFSDSQLKENFGTIYYDVMLSAFAKERDYAKAIDFGNHLSNPIFNEYKYQKEAIALTLQLKKNREDFDAFRLPNSFEWRVIKQKLNRKEQIVYLANRLRLLNCVQLNQPGGISYDMPQFSISCAQAANLGISYWAYNTPYGTINPFSELIQMKLSLQETKLLLPYLLSETYIPSYQYFRDFWPERTLHKVSWVVDELLYKITNKNFLRRNNMVRV